MIKINNWSSLQSYKDRKPPWIRLHKTLLDNYKFQSMTAESRALLPMLWLLASEDKDPVSGMLRDSYEEIVFRLRTNKKLFIASLKEIEKAGFIELSETLTDSACNETVTKPYQDCLENVTPETETEAYSKETEKKDSSYDFEEFWKSWIPYKTGKGPKSEAKTEYQKALKEIDHETIVRSSAEYCKFCEQTDCNTRNAHRWLKKRGWEDDYTLPETGETANSGSCYSDTVMAAANKARELLIPGGGERYRENCDEAFDGRTNGDCELLP